MHVRGSALLCAALLFAVGCGSDETVGKSRDLTFAAPGALSEASGKGGFRFGAASAATQIEDQNTHTDWWIFTAPASDGGLNRGSAFVGDASRGYTKALDDVALLSDLGLDSYRFSMEWARIEPTRNAIDDTALAHYDAVVDALVAAHIRPNVTIHHFSNPTWIDDPRDTACTNGPSDTNLCGFGDPVGGPLVIDEIAEHARMLAARYGDRVDDWVTVNEPINYLFLAYAVGLFPPGKQKLSRQLDEFIPVVRDYIRAHVAIYRAIKEADTVDADGDGVAASVGLTLSVGAWVPAKNNDLSDDQVDVSARDRFVYVFHHLLVDSIMGGAFDPDLDGTMDEAEPDWQNTLDWLGVQYYFRAGVTGTGTSFLPMPLALTPCFDVLNAGACVRPIDPTFCVPAMKYEFWAPGLLEVLSDFAGRWPDLPLVVSESGIATENGDRRAENIVRSLEQIAQARAQGIDVRGYYHWSVFDNFEWVSGFVPRFGLYRVDYNSYERSPTTGADVLGQIAQSRTVSRAERDQYGGPGPMRPEVEGAPLPEYCNK
jgi:beta-glucosidase/6-phospho-beta-glucosidase/beta-galactosidase